MFGLFLIAAQAATGVAAPVQCQIIAEKEEAATLLIGVCGEQAVMLGSATTYESAAHAGTGAVVAVVHRLEGTQVLMVRPGQEGSAFLENVTGDLARQAGRSADAGLGDLTVDLSRFAGNGIIGLTGATVASRNIAAQTAPALGGLSIETWVADEAARRALPKEEPRVVEVIAEGRGPEAQ
ncbi:hypothetical protein MOK15_00530 [Sphingobium sp. BYY-5]|uniref:hypothetical protein n=1 Tax=Sphingobium sp. BYY-5 TaxID=2926400 RepID=UPI001FA6C199|nr:hypothetical protein [Sphingobium sp. BYY-5]MCI4588594.1 hypothetical protein [Sphingobium sp. BYY-5]